jgi:hypothetical protein
MAIATVDYAEPSLVWEFREKLTNQITTLSAEEAVAFLQRTNPAVLIMSTSLYETNLARWKMERSVVQVQGYNFSRFDRAKFAFSKIDLTALIHP